MNTPNHTDTWLTIREAAEFTGFHPQTIRSLIRRRELACIRRARRGHIRIRRSDLDRWARANTVTALRTREELGS